MNTQVICILLFTFVFANLYSNVAIEGRWRLSTEEEIEIDNQLRMLNKPYVKTFKDKNGDSYDCVDMYKQPAFDHPLLKNESDKIRLNLQARQSMTKNPSKLRLEKCPSGTVLIKRTKKEDLIQAKNNEHVHHFHSKIHPDVDNDDGKSLHALAAFDYSKKTEPFYGAMAEMEVCRLDDLKFNQSTSAQLLLVKGDGGPEDHVNAVQFGWQIAPSVYANQDPNLFALYTSDGYKTFCLNYACGSFVQVSKSVTLGQPIPDNVATINMYAAKVMETGDWSIYYKEGNDYEEIGYWPKNLFNNMDDVKLFEVGGIVFSSPGVPSPPMGNRNIPSHDVKGAKIDHITLRSQSGLFVSPDKSTELEFVALFSYEIFNTEYLDSGFKMEYGGPGEH